MGFVIVDLTLEKPNGVLSITEYTLDNEETELKKKYDVTRIDYSIRRYPKLRNVSVIPPDLFFDEQPSSFAWQQDFTFVGPQDLFRGRGKCRCCGSSGYIPDRYMVLYSGLGFMDKPNKRGLTRIRHFHKDMKYPEINIQEAIVYDVPLLIFEEPWILNEKDYFQIACYFHSRYLLQSLLKNVDSTAHQTQTVVLLGRAYKIP